MAEHDRAHEPRSEETGVAVIGRRHQHVFDAGQVVVRLRCLVRAQDTEVAALAGRAQSHVLARDGKPARRRHDTDECVQEGRLPAPVRADQPENLPIADVE